MPILVRYDDPRVIGDAAAQGGYRGAASSGLADLVRQRQAYQARKAEKDAAEAEAQQEALTLPNIQKALLQAQIEQAAAYRLQEQMAPQEERAFTRSQQRQRARLEDAIDWVSQQKGWSQSEQEDAINQLRSRYLGITPRARPPEAPQISTVGGRQFIRRGNEWEPLPTEEPEIREIGGERFYRRGDQWQPLARDAAERDAEKQWGKALDTANRELAETHQRRQTLVEKLEEKVRDLTARGYTAADLKPYTETLNELKTVLAEGAPTEERVIARAREIYSRLGKAPTGGGAPAGAPATEGAPATKGATAGGAAADPRLGVFSEAEKPTVENVRQFVEQIRAAAKREDEKSAPPATRERAQEAQRERESRSVLTTYGSRVDLGPFAEQFRNRDWEGLAQTIKSTRLEDDSRDRPKHLWAMMSILEDLPELERLSAGTRMLAVLKRRGDMPDYRWRLVLQKLHEILPGSNPGER